VSFRTDIPLNGQIDKLRDLMLNNLILGADNSVLPDKITRYQQIIIKNITFSNLSDDDLNFIQDSLKKRIIKLRR